jgi:hypothetical protein
MILKKEAGFTLIETLTAINLSFIVVTFAVGFYLFFTKIISSSSNYIQTSSTDNTSLILIQDIFYKADSFVVHLMQDSVWINTNKKNLVFSNNKISINNIYSIDDAGIISFEILKSNKEKISWNREFNQNIFSEETINMNSNEIESLHIEYKKNDESMLISFYQPPISIRNFRNIEKEYN